MAEESTKGLSVEVESALGEFLDAGCPEEVNAYLDKAQLSHPTIRHEQLEEAPSPESIAVLPCPSGSRSANRWVPDKHGGHLFWWCQPE
jgi:hypothetical protein